MALRRLACLLFAVAALSAPPLGAAEMLPERSAESRCLTPPQDRPQALIYPAGSLARGAGGTVRIEMSFGAPDAEPGVTVLRGEDLDADLVAAVRSHVTRYRVPCLRADAAPVRFRQDFVFRPNEGRKVVWSHPSDEGASQAAACITHLRPGSAPSWPVRVADSLGKVVLRMRFEAPDQPPKVDVETGDPAHPFAREAVDWAAGLRMPCLTQPLVARQLYTFRMEGTPERLLPDVPLATFLRGARDVARLPVYFDFRTMGCPFEVRLRYWRPHEANKVGEVGMSLAARRPFLDWLSGLTLELKPAHQALAVGEEFTLTVPCGTLDL